MIGKIDVADREQARRLLSLQRASYQVEADLIGSDAIPPLHETLADLQASSETFFGYHLDAQLVGAISYKRAGSVLDIHRLMVHPSTMRRGIAQALLAHVMAVERGVARLIVATGALNTPARTLYLRQGFTVIGEREVVPGLVITEFEKRL